jgi:hypothetical protein
MPMRVLSCLLWMKMKMKLTTTTKTKMKTKWSSDAEISSIEPVKELVVYVLSWKKSHIVMDGMIFTPNVLHCTAIVLYCTLPFLFNSIQFNSIQFNSNASCHVMSCLVPSLFFSCTIANNYFYCFLSFWT